MRRVAGRLTRLVQLEREPVRVGEEREPPARERIYADRLDLHPGRLQVGDRRVEFADGEREVPQPLGLGPRRAGRRTGEREQLDPGAVREPEVELARVPLARYVSATTGSPSVSV